MLYISIEACILKNSFTWKFFKCHERKFFVATENQSSQRPDSYEAVIRGVGFMLS